ncbi:MAG: hypothetical protein M3P89_10585, partial [Actinomycetota bacterium]|nr:hypothetical protein [Actinomycetota bacterium]
MAEHRAGGQDEQYGYGVHEVPGAGVGARDRLGAGIDALADADPPFRAQLGLDAVHVVADRERFLGGEDAEAPARDALEDGIHRRSVRHTDASASVVRSS